MNHSLRLGSWQASVNSSMPSNMLSNYFGWIIIIILALLIVYMFFWWVQAKIKHKKDCDTSTGKQKDLNNSLFQAVADGNARKVEEAIVAGADVNVRGRGGKTPLIKIAHRAAEARYYNDKANLIIAKILVEKGADVNINDLFNGSAIQYCDLALPGFSPQIADFLQKNNAQKLPRNSSTESSL